MNSKKKFPNIFIDYMKKFFIRRKEYLHNKDYFIKTNEKRMIHLNNVNYRIPFSIYIKVENDIQQNQNKSSAKTSETKNYEIVRKKLYEKYGYKYYPLIKDMKFNENTKDVKGEL